jgi:hypothetical protein
MVNCVSLTIPPEIVVDCKKYKINMSEVSRKALKREVLKRKNVSDEIINSMSFTVTDTDFPSENNSVVEE